MTTSQIIRTIVESTMILGVFIALMYEENIANFETKAFSKVKSFFRGDK